MKMRIIIPGLLVLIALIAPVWAATDSATAEITVTNYSIEPTHLMAGDTGKLSVTIKNTGDGVVKIYSAALDPPTGANGFKILNDQTYGSVGAIGPDDTRTFTFTFTANVADGVYYPKFYLDLDTAGSFRQYIPVDVKSTEIIATVDEDPAAFSSGKKSEIIVSVGNPRQNAVNAVTVTPSGEGMTFSPKQAFIGQLAADSSTDVTFKVTPQRETTATFVITYRNGMNDHSTTVTLPITFSDDKLGAKTVLNNVGISSGGQYNTITGDITNAGLSNAYGIIVTVGAPATPVDPNKVYVIGELAPDDFSSFEVTYIGSGSRIPVIVTYKDADGNTFTETIEVTSSVGGMAAIGSGSSSGSTSGSTTVSGATGGVRAGGPGGGGFFFGMGSRGGASSIPFTEIGIGLLIVLVVIIVAWKKGYIRKLKERIPQRKPSEDDDDLSDR